MAGEDVLRWASFVAPILAFIGVWVKVGEYKQIVADLRKTVDDLSHNVAANMTVVIGKHELLRDEVARNQVEAVREFATREEVRDALQEVTRSIKELGRELNNIVRQGRES